MQESNPQLSPNDVQVHLVVHQQNEDLKIDFNFNKLNDDIDSIVTELIETLGMTEEDRGTIKSLIEQQINPPPKQGQPNHDTYFEPIAENPPSDQSDDSSDDADITDPEYKSLLEKQRRDMQNLLSRQLSERRELAQQIQASMHHLPAHLLPQPQANPHSHQQIPPGQSNSVQPNPPMVMKPDQQSSAPAASPQSATDPSSVCDDLIVF